MIQHLDALDQASHDEMVSGKVHLEHLLESQGSYSHCPLKMGTKKSRIMDKKVPKYVDKWTICHIILALNLLKWTKLLNILLPINTGKQKKLISVHLALSC